jgi:hemolysin D
LQASTSTRTGIGFVTAGQAAEVKVETFSFTRYGTLPATVRWVTQDAVNDEKRGAIFPATLRLDRSAIEVNGKLMRLAPGMQVSAEVKTGRRRVIEFLLAPVQQAVSLSAKER